LMNGKTTARTLTSKSLDQYTDWEVLARTDPNWARAVAAEGSLSIAAV
jgi:hypothetical protein